jgi:hypothetical protein
MLNANLGRFKKKKVGRYFGMDERKIPDLVGFVDTLPIGAMRGVLAAMNGRVREVAYSCTSRPAAIST